MLTTTMRGLACAAGVLMSGLCTQTIAAEVTAKGTATYATTSEATDLRKGEKLVRTQFKGVTLADDAKSSIHMSLQNCSGTTLLNKKGEPQSGGGYCDGVDADGDIWLISWQSHATSSDWSFTGGTGKYKGAKGGGKTENVLQAPDRLVIKWEGTWTTAK